MIVLRSKNFAVTDPKEQQEALNQQMVTSRDLQIEQMKQQMQILQTQRLREKIAAQERRDSMKNLQEAQKQETKQNESENKNLIKTAKIQDQREEAKNVGLYKTRSKPVQPVPMKV
jgi:hypothetical protein